MEITKDIRYVGVNDHEVDLFEGQYVVPNGMAYNSYVILDEKIAVMDTVDRNFTHEWLDNIAAVLGGRKPDYLVREFYENLSGGNGCFQRKGVCDDAELFRDGFCRRAYRGERGRHAESRKAYAYVCSGADGTLAGGYRDV